MKRLVEKYIAAGRHKGKQRILMWLLSVLPYRTLQSHHGPILRLNPHDKTSKLAISGQYGAVIANHIKTFKPDDFFIDIGANYGLFSLLASQTLTKGHIAAFEPNPAIHQYLLENIALNKANNIRPYQCAVGSGQGVARMSLSPEHSGKGHIARADDHSDTLHEVEVKALAEDVEIAGEIGARRVHVKIDVEGFEAQILKSLAKAPWFDQIASFVIEIDEENLNNFDSSAKTDIYDLLESSGFGCRFGLQNGRHYDEIFIRSA